MDEVISIIKQTNLYNFDKRRWNNRIKEILKNNPNLISMIIKSTPFLLDTASVKVRLYHVVTGSNIFPKCTCGNFLSFSEKKFSYPVSCCKECAIKTADSTKRIKTNGKTIYDIAQQKRLTALTTIKPNGFTGFQEMR